MAFLDKLGKTIGNAAGTATEKAKQLSLIPLFLLKKNKLLNIF